MTATPTPDTGAVPEVGLPVGFRITLDPSAKQLRDGLWFGGMPPRVLRLTEAGRRAWTEVQQGPVTSRAGGALARRFVDAGLANPVPPATTETPTETPDVTIIVPVRDRADELEHCLAALGTEHPVVVVDDGSHDRHQVAAVIDRHGAKLIRREVNGGPGAARNTGLDAVTTPFVAFVDSDCAPPPGWLERLLPHFADPLVGAVAPRITADAAQTSVGRYSRALGSLDLGGAAARIAPLTRVAYVPTAALVVRRTAVPQFDETLRVGEDVDLIWRMHAQGWRLRYDPSVEVPHHEPASWGGVLARRLRYGTSAAPLARRHPHEFAPLVLHPWPAVAAGALLARRPLLAAVAASAGTAVLARTLHRADVPTVGLLPAFGSSILQTGLGIGRYLSQLAAPVLVAGLVNRRTRLSAATLLLAPALDAWRRDRSLPPLPYVMGMLADEIAYGAGIWVGCARERTLAPIRPVVVRRPVRIESRRS